MIICFGIQFPQKLAAPARAMEVCYPFRPCGSSKGAADHKNCDFFAQN
ncbi:hypothetical protein NSP_10680 [Nodularia spumigena CCY9414]|nr:hypothetical protein NSP_10680 [Nodularia spumigena CCY9414]